MAKRGQGEGTISKRPDGTWWARITVGRDENGRQKRKAFYGKTRKEVQDKLAAAVNDVNNDTYVEPSKMTVSQWMDIWFEEYKKRTLKQSTHASYFYNINAHIKPAIGHYRLNELRTDAIQKFINNLADEKQLSPTTIKKIFTFINSALKQAVDNGLLLRNPADSVQKPRLIKPEIKILTPDEQKEFIKAAKEVRNAEIFIVALGTGLRRGELLGLTWDNVDFKSHSLTVTQSRVLASNAKETPGKRKIMVVDTPKTKSSIRVIPLLPDIEKVLKEVKERQDIGRQFYKDTYQESDFVFCKDDGTPLSAYMVEYLFDKVKLKADIKGFHLHCLRHTFASRCLESGVPMKVVQELLGHASMNMTANIYTHVLPEQKVAAIEKLQDSIVI